MRGGEGGVGRAGTRGVEASATCGSAGCNGVVAIKVVNFHDAAQRVSVLNRKRDAVGCSCSAVAAVVSSYETRQTPNASPIPR